MASQKTVEQLMAENATLTAQLAEARAAVQRLSQSVWVDQGAEELAKYVYDRMPGLRVSTFLGGPTLSEPAKTENGDRASVMMLIKTPDGRTYGVEVYRVGDKT